MGKKLFTKKEVAEHKKMLVIISKSLAADGLAISKFVGRSLAIIRQLERPRRDYS